MNKVRRFTAAVEYKDAEGRTREESFPVNVEDYPTAKSLAVEYAIRILRLQDFELRIVGS